jgi:hypothetical protein
MGVVFLACAVLSVGCGNPEAPKIENVKLSYWDSLTGEGSWVPLESGGVAPQSPIRVRGSVSDNTAVVNPRITWVGERGDVDEAGFVACSDGVRELYECVMDCEETQEGFFACNPLLPSRNLMRGDRYSLVMKTVEGETFELEIRVSEAQDLAVPESESEPIQVQEDYRILAVSSLEGDPNPFLWSLFQRKTTGGPWMPLRSGDVLALEAGDSAFQIGVQVPDGVTLENPPEATWSSLVKWNDSFFLNWDATTGEFEQTYQIYDPRDEQERIDGVGQATFRYVISAEDVPDQKTKEFRYSEVAVDLIFSPERAAMAPDLEVDGEDEGLIETRIPGESRPGTVESFTGEVRSLLYALSEGPASTDPRLLYVDSDLISLAGDFSESIIYVSDWDGDGVVDEPQENGGIPNLVEVVALDSQGNWTRKSVSVSFVIPSTKDGPPELEIREIFPAIDRDGEGLLPFGEEMRLRARAADDRGQPQLSGWVCHCRAEEPLINDDRCPCSLEGVGDGNAGGAFPVNPWEWIVIEPTSETEKSVAFLRATEKVEEEEDKPTAKFTTIPIDIQPDAESETYTVKIGFAESQGPAVTVVNMENGDIVDPDNLIVEARIFPHFTELNQITALWNGVPRGDPTYDSTFGAFVWDLQAYTVREGDRICVGGVAIDGHATLNILEFADTAEGLLLGVTVTTDLSECDRPGSG